MEKKFWFLLLTATTLCSTVSAQDMRSFHLNVQRQQSNREALSYYKDNTHQLDEAFDHLDKLWTSEHLSRLQQASDNGSTISQSCIESTFVILEYGSKNISITPNISVWVPGPMVIPLLDATGKPGAGLLAGNVLLDGAYDECLAKNLTYTSFCYAERIGLVNANTTLTKQLVWTAGLCVPRGCNESDVALAINLTGIFETNLTDMRCTNTKKPGYSVGAIVMLVVCAVFAVWVLIGTIVDRVVEVVPNFLQSLKKTERVYVDPSINNDDSTSEKSHLLTQSTVVRAKAKTKVTLLDFITASSLYKTVPALLATNQAPGVITSLNGMRVISMFWVILGHTYFWIFTNTSVRIDNFISMLDVAGRFSYQAVLSAFFAVDTFFFLSGVLVAYLTLRTMQKRKGNFLVRFPFVNYYAHRYLRLTPTYAFVLFFAWFLTIHLSYGPIISLHDPFAQNCEKYWWTNFLYINNLYPWNMGDECVGWTWYLANDMQFYVISPLILIPLFYFFPVGLVIAFVFLVGSLVITSVLTAVYDFQANAFAFIAYGYGGKPTDLMTYQDAIYIKPWNRLAPYLVGLVLGYVFYRGFHLGKLHNKLLKLLIYVAMWCVAGFVMFWLVYGLYFTWHGHVPGKFENNIYITFSRFIWALCLALIIFACHNGYGFFVNSFLSMPMWTPLSRLTFNAYLLHPVVMTAIYGQLQNALHYTDVTIAGFAVMFTVMSYGAAVVVCLGVEFPLGTVEMLVFKLFGFKSRESMRQGEVDLSMAKAAKASE